MKNILKYAALLLLAGFTLTGCETETTPERKVVQHPDEQTPLVRDNAYYARLRAYKKTNHKLAFGWFGSWNPDNASKMATLNHAPDSMDIISIWSQWYMLTPAQMKDKAFVQKTKGTKVTFTVFAHDVPAQFKEDGNITPEGLAAYAKAYAKDSLEKYQYDGIDLDYEPGFASGDFLKNTRIWNTPINDRKYNDDLKIFIQELSKYVGPASGTGRLLIIDGVPYGVYPEQAPLFDYGIVQAYYSGSYWDLQSRFNDAFDGGWKPEQYIFTEDFEKGWQKGGVSHQTRDGQVVPSLYGMALFNPDQGTGAGFGAYHMEYEYGHNDMVYKFMRKAIQLVNPAPAGDLTKTLISINESENMSTFQIDQTPSGHLYGTVATEITGKISAVPTEDTDITLTVDNDFVAAYNAENDTEYKTIDPSLVIISGALHFAAGEQYTNAPVSITVPGIGTLENGSYMVVVKPDVAQSKEYGVNEKAAQKILVINKAATQIKVSVTGGSTTNISVMELLDGSIKGEIKATISAKLSLPAITAIDVNFKADNALAAAYNEAYGTEYMTVSEGKVVLTNKLHADQEASEFTGTINVTVPAGELKQGTTIVALRPDLASLEDYAADEKLGVKYLLIYKGKENIAPDQTLEAFEDKCTQIENTDNKLKWGFTVENLRAGGSGVWSEDYIGNMFDGNTSQSWYCIWGNTYSWARGIGGRLTLDMKNAQTVSVLRWYQTRGAASKMSVIEISDDGETWITQNSGEVSIANGNPQWISFVQPVTARYIRLVVTDGHASYFGFSEVEVWAPKAQ